MVWYVHRCLRGYIDDQHPSNALLLPGLAKGLRTATLSAPPMRRRCC